MSASVSRNPVRTVSGVFNSWDTLAMKSRRSRATASSRVMSRLINNFSSMPKGTIWIDSVIPVSRCDSTTTGSLKSPLARYCTNAG